MAIHETKIKWHDLIEDPNDLPIGETKTNFIVVYNKNTNTTFKIYGDDIAIEYLELCNCWRITSYDYDEDGNPEPHEYVESYKHEQIDSEKLNGYLLYDQVVIAWSEEVEEYIPDIFGDKN